MKLVLCNFLWFRIQTCACHQSCCHPPCAIQHHRHLHHHHPPVCGPPLAVVAWPQALLLVCWGKVTDYQSSPPICQWPCLTMCCLLSLRINLSHPVTLCLPLTCCLTSTLCVSMCVLQCRGNLDICSIPHYFAQCCPFSCFHLFLKGTFFCQPPTFG